MKCFVSLIFLATWAVSPITADEPKEAPKTISLWDQEQDRLRHEIEKLQKQLEAAESLLQKRTANRKQYEKQSIESEQEKVSKEAEQPANEDDPDDSDRLIPEFESPPTWKEFFEALCERHDIALEAIEYPPGIVDLQEIEALSEDVGDAFLVWLTQQLRNEGFELWVPGDKLKITKHPPKGHPLLGMWESKKIIEGGKPSDEKVILIITRRFGMFFHGEETDMFNYAVTPSEPGSNPELEMYFPDGNTHLEGSFKVDEDHAEILWGEVSEEGLPTGEMVFMKLQRIE